MIDIADASLRWADGRVWIVAFGFHCQRGAGENSPRNVARPLLAALGVTRSASAAFLRW